jgi:hypothetical protein
MKSGDSILSPLISEGTAARILNIAPGTLANWRWQGVGPRFIKVGNRIIRYRVEDLWQFVDQGSVDTDFDSGTVGVGNP